MTDETPIKTGIAPKDVLAKMTGLEAMQAIIAGELPGASIADLLNFRLVEVAFGMAAFEGSANLSHSNPVGTIHGGWYGAIMDSALGCAVHTTLPVGAGYTTLEYKVNITRGVPCDTKVRATATVSHSGRSTAVAEAKLVGVDDGKLYATGSTTCIIFAPKPA